MITSRERSQSAKKPVGKAIQFQLKKPRNRVHLFFGLCSLSLKILPFLKVTPQLPIQTLAVTLGKTHSVMEYSLKKKTSVMELEHKSLNESKRNAFLWFYILYLHAITQWRYFRGRRKTNPNSQFKPLYNVSFEFEPAKGRVIIMQVQCCNSQFS